MYDLYRNITSFCSKVIFEGTVWVEAGECSTLVIPRLEMHNCGRLIVEWTSVVSVSSCVVALSCDLKSVSNTISCQRLRSASTTALVVPATWRSMLGDRAFPAAWPGMHWRLKSLQRCLCHHAGGYWRPNFSLFLSSGTFLHDINVHFWPCSVVLQCLHLHHVNPVVMVMMIVMMSRCIKRMETINVVCLTDALSKEPCLAVCSSV